MAAATKHSMEGRCNEREARGKRNSIVLGALDEHLSDATTYVKISEADAIKASNDLFTEIYQWTRTAGMSLSQDARTYIRYWIQKNRFDPFGYFYLTIKIHKNPVSTRPVCSDCASLVHPLGKWLDYALQPVVANQPFYFKDSFSLKQELVKIVLPPNASIITFDAVSMSTNINIDDSIERISMFLADIWDKHKCKAIKSAMEIVMKNNRAGLVFRPCVWMWRTCCWKIVLSPFGDCLPTLYATTTRVL